VEGRDDVRKATGALLVGSVNLPTGDDVFRTAGRLLGRHLAAVPDGEPGDRNNWIGWQMPALAAVDGIEFGAPVTSPGSYEPFPQLTLTKPAAEIRLTSLGYADAAIASYRRFTHLRGAGAVPAGVRFQVALPTPLAVVNSWVAMEHRDAFEPVYTAALVAEHDAIARSIPVEDLAIQWDIAVEIGILEGAFLARPRHDYCGIVERIRAFAERSADSGAAVGLHLCYGDYQHSHFKEPETLGLCVRLANDVAKVRDGHWLDFVHMPVPPGKEAAYFEPLAELSPTTGKLYLGVVHDPSHTTEAEDRRLVELAERHSPGSFGVATECGIGRVPQPEIEPLLARHATLADPIR
jgi:hypothetical protein